MPEIPELERAKGSVLICPECDYVETSNQIRLCPVCRRNAEDGVRTHHAEEAGRDA